MVLLRNWCIAVFFTEKYNKVFTIFSALIRSTKLTKILQSLRFTIRKESLDPRSKVITQIKRKGSADQVKSAVQGKLQSKVIFQSILDFLQKLIYDFSSLLNFDIEE